MNTYQHMILFLLLTPIALFAQLKPGEFVNYSTNTVSQDLLTKHPESYSWINWTAGELVTEYRVPLSYQDPNIGRVLENSTAKLMERMRQYILSTALKVQVSSVFIVDNFFIRNETIRSRLLSSLYSLPLENTTIKDSYILGKVSFPLYGKNSVSAPFYQNLQTRKLTNYIQRETASSQYYDFVVIDTVMFPKFQPSLMPRIVNEQGEVIHSVEFVNPAVLNKQGSVHFVSSLTEALKQQKRGSRVAYIFPKRVEGATPSDIVLFDSDVQRIFSQKRTVDSLYQGNLIIVKPQEK